MSAVGIDGRLQCTFDHLHVYCTDLARSEGWFINVLGAEAIEQRVGPPRSVVLEVGGVTFLLRGRLDGEQFAEPAPPGFGLNHFALTVKDLDAAVETVRKRSGSVPVETYGNRNLRVAFLAGPDEIRIELIERISLNRSAQDEPPTSALGS
jgi:lactoylglutathione lyase